MNLMRRKLIVEKYNSSWKKEFQEIDRILSKVLQGKFQVIEHVGSTSVEGLASKPVLDIDIIVKSIPEMENLIPDLEKLGYYFNGDLGIPLRYSFKRKDELVPYTTPSRKWMLQNLYVCIEDSLSLRNHIIFRDTLRKSPDLIRIYGELKHHLSVKYSQLSYAEAIDLYCEEKTDFIVNVLSRQGVSEEEAKKISQANR